MVVKNGRLIGFYEFLNRMSKSTLTVKAFTCILTTYAVLFCGYVSAQNVKLSELDQQLTLLESKRTQSPPFVAESLKEVSPLIKDMSVEQKYRFRLLQAHSYAMSDNLEAGIKLLVGEVSKPFVLDLAKYRTRMMSLLANIYAADNNYVEAIQTLQHLFPLLSDANDIISEVHGYTLAVELFGELGMPNEALIYANIIYKQFDQIKSPRYQCFTALDYAASIEGVYGEVVEKWSEIDALYQDAFEFCTLANEGLMIAEIALGQARMLIKRKQYVEAWELTQHGLALSSSIPYRPNIAKAHLLLAKIALYQQQPQSQLEHLDKALALSLTIENSRLLSEVYQSLAKLHEALGHTDKALAYLKGYQTHHTKILGETQRQIIALEVSTLGNLAKVRQIDELNKELNAVKAELTAAEYDHQRLMLMMSCLVTLILFTTCMVLLKRSNGADRQVFKGLKS
ncbi:hypothetical protein HQQ94_08500 [Shewanella sp. VB17]|uniref:tetratricopeptide repeat protein n=1 Tax=Shewanella sp. VB17 TaxID=2739432 RepID=UPI0015644138|nr:hypothetical protein [Shewanella sp. VB17]NRD73281.1 hypothetical protein [Shewanella sp. VB17]